MRRRRTEAEFDAAFRNRMAAFAPPDPQDAPPRCPDCGGELDVQRRITVDEPYFPTHPLRGEPLPRRERVAAAVAFCNGCEYAVEVDS